VLPTHDGVVLAKVLSLDSDAACLKRKSLLRRKQHMHSTDDASFLAPAPLQADKKSEVTPAQHKPVAQAACRPDHHQQQQQQQPQAPASKEHNFFSTSTDEEEQSSSPSASSHRSPVVSASHAPAPTAVPTPAPALNRADLAQKRHDDIEGKVAAALAEKKGVSVLY
jgi:hypothetical protein